jgi:glycosyltransferase involved in cell wall biosynthesis
MSCPAGKPIAVLGLSHPFRGGIAHYSTLLVRELRRHHPVRFLTLRRQYPAFLFPGNSQYDESAAAITEENEPIIDSINPLTWLRTAFTLWQGGYDLVVVQWWNPFFGLAFGTIAKLLRLVSRARICFLCHNVLPHEGSRFDRWLTGYAFRGASHFVVHSEQDKAKLLALAPRAAVIKTKHPSYAVFGAQDVCDKAVARRRLGLSVDRSTLLFFGLIRPYKGLEYLLRAMPRVLREVDCVLLVVGEFYEPKDRYIRLIEDLRLGERVELIDRYVKNEEVSRYFRSADVVVLPYVDATQSGVVQIAHGLEVPVITTDVGGLPEIVENGRTGFVVASRSPEQLAEAIGRFYREGREASFRSEIARRRDEFDWRQETEAITSLLSDEASGAGASAARAREACGRVRR